MRKKSKNSKKQFVLNGLIAIIFVVIAFLTIGYSAFSDNLGITDTVAHVRIFKLVRINGVTTNSGLASDIDYSHSSIISDVSIPSGSSITYSTKVTNLGNTPVAVSNVTFTNRSGEEIQGLSANINSNNYEKICDGNNCIGPVTKTIDITITNNSGERITGNLIAHLTFSNLYTVKYEGNVIGDYVLEDGTFTYTFESNPPANIAKKSGQCDPVIYENNTITINNVKSDIELLNAYTVYYNGSTLGHVEEGGTFSKSLEPEFPVSVTKESGTCDTPIYQAHTVTLTNVMSDVYLTGTIGKVAITDIRYISSHNVVNPTDAANQPQFTGEDLNVSFNVVFRKDEGSEYDDFQVTYEIDLTNTHYNNYIFRGFDFHPTITASTESDTAQLTLTPIGIANGDTVASETTKTFRVTLNLNANNMEGEYTTGGTTQVDTTEDNQEETGEITGTISPNTGSLKSNAEAEFTVNITSTYPSERTYTLNSSNSNIEIVKCSSGGTALESKKITAQSSPDSYSICLRAVNGAKFVGDTDTTTVYLSTDSSARVDLGTLTLNVDKHDVPDTTPVTVGNVAIAMHRDTSTAAPTTGQIDVTWNRIDVGGASVTDYVIQLYDDSNSLISTGHTNSSTRSYSFTDIDDGTYHAVVYGIDAAPNSGESSASATTSTANGYASASTAVTFDWRFNVDTSQVSNLDISGDGSTAYLEKSHTVILKVSGSNNNYIVPEAANVTVKMGNKTLTQGTNRDYTYTISSDYKTATIVIKKVTGDISIQAARETASADTPCLIKGTKVLLANGQYKNIENIKYDDLLVTYSYETGTFVNEYPIWIEKPKHTKYYQETTFSDGTVLKTYGYHGVYETKLKRFVSVDNPEEFHVGSTIAKINDNNDGFDEVTVTSIRMIYEDTTYYQVVSTRYFNIIANDLLTVDGTVVLSNLYGFNDDITWVKKIRNENLKEVYSYDELKDILPYYMFKGMRAEEGKALTKYGIGLKEYKEFIKIIVDEEKMKLLPMQMYNKNVWMVTTSLDNVTDLNKNNYLRVEGSTYTLPKVNDKNFIGWLNHSDNLMYQPGDKITVYYGMHFEAIYK